MRLNTLANRLSTLANWTLAKRLVSETTDICSERQIFQGPRSKFSSGGAEECVKEIILGAGGKACLFLFNFSKVTENAIITIKVFFSTSSVMMVLGLD